MASIKINLPTLTKYREIFSSDLRFKQNAPIRDCLNRWRELYSQYLVERYFSFSHGGGDWPALKPATIERKKRKGLLLEILRATDLLFQSFAAEFNKPTGKEFGISVSFGGGTGVSYPGETITPAEVGMFHQVGGGRLPKRPIIVKPDRRTLLAMRHELKQTLMQMYNAST